MHTVQGVRTTGAYGAVLEFFKQKLSGSPITIVGNGKQSRDFIYVSDVVNAFYKASTTSNSGQIYNLGNDNPRTVNELANLIGGKKTYIPERPGEPKLLGKYFKNKKRIKLETLK